MWRTFVLCIKFSGEISLKLVPLVLSPGEVFTCTSWNVIYIDIVTQLEETLKEALKSSLEIASESKKVRASSLRSSNLVLTNSLDFLLYQVQDLPFSLKFELLIELGTFHSQANTSFCVRWRKEIQMFPSASLFYKFSHFPHFFHFPQS